jgi:prophage regulatory protein
MRIWRKPELKAKFGYKSDTSVSVRVADGTLTRPVKIGLRSVGWPDEEVDLICAAQIAGKSREELKELVNRLHARRVEIGNLMGPICGRQTTNRRAPDPPGTLQATRESGS